MHVCVLLLHVVIFLLVPDFSTRLRIFEGKNIMNPHFGLK